MLSLREEPLLVTGRAAGAGEDGGQIWGSGGWEHQRGEPDRNQRSGQDQGGGVKRWQDGGNCPNMPESLSVPLPNDS